MPAESALEQSRRCRLAPIGYWTALAVAGARLARPAAHARCPGCCTAWSVTAFGLLLLLLAHRHFWLLAGAFSGFLFIGPLAATGLYAVSRALEQGQRPTLGTALAAWRPRTTGWCCSGCCWPPPAPAG